MRLLWAVDIPVWFPYGLETIVNLAVLLTGTVITALYFHQDKLIYMSAFPQGSRDVVSTPDQMHMPDYENVILTTPDNVKITGYAIKYRPQLELLRQDDNDPASSLRYRKPDGKQHDVAPYTLLYLHANAGNMGHRLPIARVIRARAGMNVFMLSYRGYGKSDGVATENGIKIDSQAALDWIANHEELGKTKIVLYGQSIGGAVALDLASRNPDRITAVIIENTFLSLPKLIPSVMPYLKPLIFLCHQMWESEKAIKKIPSSVPILFLSGGKDELIPQKHMIELVQIARRARAGGKLVDEEKEKNADGKPVKDKQRVRWVEFTNGGHNDTVMQEGYFEEVIAFLFELMQGKL
ncbi:alpha/beta-hydrolase [Rhizoclosmatium globosum]|uniref:Alpha/beta-hydrolase n=1 Tax=Rhizoclosmatium globosum TaxID=329046 RepID=A0A1Y2CEY2_9FUNG|nr:alpha/beta-hydrolase [Rhizoclosmatium globosum]|eukprot:ORY45610.1 alpha/beta-hydrolase [Rhizoclosmatium globosum]